MPFFYKEKREGSKAYYLEAFWREDKVALESHFCLSFAVQTKLASHPFFFPRELPPPQKDLFFLAFTVWGQRVIVLQSAFISSTLKQDETAKQGKGNQTHRNRKIWQHLAQFA
jgi:hypothetical protein